MDASKIKLIIWDLDETFWNGTISEQKVAPVKQACDLVLLSSKKGIVNSICSKNDFSAAKQKSVHCFRLSCTEYTYCNHY